MRRKSMKRLSFLLVVLLIISLFPITTYASGGTFTTVTYGSRDYKIYVPSTYDGTTEVPLMVMLHGGAQDPDQFAAGTRMNQLAEEKNFIVIYPRQPQSANSSKCWNWFETAHQHRGTGEPALIVGMINDVKSNYNINDNMVYAAGISAGGAMSVILAATYPDVIHGIGVQSGLEYIAATSMMGAFTAMSSGGPAPNTQGVTAYNEMAKSIAGLMPVIVFHGTSDYTVNITNGHQILSQWAQTNDLADDGTDNNSIDDVADIVENKSVEGGRTYTRYAYEDASGNILMEKYLVDGMGHAWSGGSTAGNYTDAAGPDATGIIWSFLTGETIVTPEDPPTDPGDPTVITVNGTATEHYVAGRLDVNGYLAMGTKYGYIAKFNLYQVEGTNVWTDINPTE